MKYRQLTWPMLIVAGGLATCEEKSASDAPEAAAEVAKAADAVAKTAEGAAAAAPTAAPTPPPPPAPPPMPSAAEVCGDVVMAIKGKNDAKFGGLVTPATTAALANHEAKEHIFKSLSEGTCGAAQVEEERATVTVSVMGASQDVPFVKLADGWKLDGVSYLEKYPVKGKGKKPAPAHGKGKEHGKHKK